MIQPPAPQQLFKAIENRSLSDVQEYLSLGGTVEGLTSARGYAPLVEVAMQFSKLGSEMKSEWENEMDEIMDEDDTLTAHAPKELSKDSRFEALVQIGSLLLENGSNYEARAGRSNRSIRLRDMMASRYPEAHREWDAVALKASMLKTVKEGVDLDSKSNPIVRKI